MIFKLNESIPDLDTTDNIYNNLINILDNYNIIDNTKKINSIYHNHFDNSTYEYIFEFSINEIAYDEYSLYTYKDYKYKSFEIFIGCCNECIIYKYSDLFKHNNITPRIILEHLINLDI